jgi:hypothetical protein
MEVVSMAGGQVSPRNQTAGTDSKLKIEGMTNQPIFFRQPRQDARLWFCL